MAKTQATISWIITTMLSVPALTGCGLQGGALNAAQAGNGTVQNASLSTASTTASTASTTPTSTVAPLNLPVGAVGYVSTTVTVSTGRILRLEFTPGQATQATSDTGVVPEYSMLGVYITVGNMSQATPMLSNGYGGTTAQTSPVFDFSSAVATNCPSSGSCTNSVVITISKPNTDYWCLNFGTMCPYNRISNDQPWNGVLIVQTDDTASL